VTYGRIKDQRLSQKDVPYTPASSANHPAERNDSSKGRDNDQHVDGAISGTMIASIIDRPTIIGSVPYLMYSRSNLNRIPGGSSSTMNTMHIHHRTGTEKQRRTTHFFRRESVASPWYLYPFPRCLVRDSLLSSGRGSLAQSRSQASTRSMCWRSEGKVTACFGCIGGFASLALCVLIVRALVNSHVYAASNPTKPWN